MNRVFCVIACSLLLSGIATADDWGHVSGQILWKGDVPKPKLMHQAGAAIKDAATCAAKDTYENSLLVDEDTKGIANVCIFLRKAPKKVHPDAKDFEPSILFDQEFCRFKPHVLMVRAGQTVEVLNSDPVAHNTHTNPLKNTGQNQAISPMTAAGSGVPYPTKVAEMLPVSVVCDFHPWMKAYWMVLDHPYGAITAEDGTFEIKNLPVGKHEFRVWHERQGWLERSLKVEIKADETTELKPLEYTITK